MGKNKKITVGVIGYGGIGKSHTSIITDRLPEAEVKIICDIRFDNVNSIKLNNRSISVTRDHKDILNDPEINTVLICTPINSHTDLIIDCANAGKNIFCEKQIGIDPVKVKKSLEIVKKNKVKLQVGYMRRFDKNYMKLKERIDNGELGKQYITRITSRDVDLPPIDYLKDSPGIFHDMTSHDFDIVRYLTGSEIEEVYVSGGVLIEEFLLEVNDYDTVLVVFKLSNGSVGTIENCMKTAYGYDQRVELFGSKSCLLVDNMMQTQIRSYNKHGIARDRLYSSKTEFFIERYHDAYIEQFRHMFDSIINDEDIAVDGMDGLKNVLVAEAARESAINNVPVRIDYGIC